MTHNKLEVLFEEAKRELGLEYVDVDGQVLFDQCRVMYKHGHVPGKRNGDEALNSSPARVNKRARISKGTTDHDGGGQGSVRLGEENDMGQGSVKLDEMGLKAPPKVVSQTEHDGIIEVLNYKFRLLPQYVDSTEPCTVRLSLIKHLSEKLKSTPGQDGSDSSPSEQQSILVDFLENEIVERYQRAREVELATVEAVTQMETSVAAAKVVTQTLMEMETAESITPMEMIARLQPAPMHMHT